MKNFCGFKTFVSLANKDVILILHLNVRKDKQQGYRKEILKVYKYNN